MLTEFVSAVESGIVPKLSVPALQSGCASTVMQCPPASIRSCCGVNPALSAPVAVTILNVDPGAYRPWVARFRSGAPVRVLRWGKFCSTLVGLKLGEEYMVTTRPVLGSIATTAPVRPARPFWAAF